MYSRNRGVLHAPAFLAMVHTFAPVLTWPLSRCRFPRAERIGDCLSCFRRAVISVVVHSCTPSAISESIYTSPSSPLHGEGGEEAIQLGQEPTSGLRVTGNILDEEGLRLAPGVSYYRQVDPSATIRVLQANTMFPSAGSWAHRDRVPR